MFGKDPRQYSVMTKEFLSDDDGNVRGLITVEVEVTKDGIKVSHGGTICDRWRGRGQDKRDAEGRAHLLSVFGWMVDLLSHRDD